MRLMVFTDLDGTLLDHATYSWHAARPALDRLRALDVPLVLASSKTAAEIAPLHADLRLGSWPAIVENGAALVRPDTAATGQGDGYATLRAALEGLPPDLRQGFQGFGDMGPAQVAALTGLTEAQAARAKARQHSEPGLWIGDDPQRAAFLAALARQGITARSGGRFLTLSHGATKADQMRHLIATHRPDMTLALGDAPNDRELLEAATTGVIVRNDGGPGLPTLPGEADGRIRRTSQEGPAGWNDAVLSILFDLGMTDR